MRNFRDNGNNRLLTPSTTTTRLNGYEGNSRKSRDANSPLLTVEYTTGKSGLSKMVRRGEPGDYLSKEDELDLTVDGIVTLNGGRRCQTFL